MTSVFYSTAFGHGWGGTIGIDFETVWKHLFEYLQVHPNGSKCHRHTPPLPLDHMVLHSRGLHPTRFARQQWQIKSGLFAT